MPIFEFPSGLVEMAHFSVPRIQTWGSSRDQEFKEQVRRAAGLQQGAGSGYLWFVFVIRCEVAQPRLKIPRQIPDVENIPKLIVDAFTGVLYPDDDIRYVRGVQVEAVPDNSDQTEVWIFGMPVG
jgi:Holliday junction resolvase RusA-like endonuclease